MQRSLAETQRVLEERKAERDAWRASAQSALEGLGHAVDEQFRKWGLTPTEREVALLLLKGHSHKAIAYATDRSERTVGQHAVAVYQKSKLGGRAELAAFFLEDLMLPDEAREVVHTAQDGSGSQASRSGRTWSTRRSTSGAGSWASTSTASSSARATRSAR